MANSGSFKPMNFDAKKDKDIITLVRNFFDNSRNQQDAKHTEFQRIYNMYKLVQDMTNKDKNRANIFIPKMFAAIETIHPRYVDALLGIRPYIPIELNQNRNADISDVQTQVLDMFLHDSNFFIESVKWIKYAILYGTAFVESSPMFINKTVKEFETETITNFAGEQIPINTRVVTKEKKMFSLKVRAYAPWEIYGDWNASSIDDARAIIKFRGLMSRKQLKKMAERGDFGSEFDVGQLDKQAPNEFRNDDWSKRMAEDIGVPLVQGDDDLGLWLSYESDDRYIDLWNFSDVLRDQSNPYEHNKINLTKIINTDDPNPRYSWFGVGDGRPIENLCYALNDNWNQTIDNHNMINHGVFFYKEDALNVDQLVMVAGNRIPVETDMNQTITDAVFERGAPGLPADHYAVPDVLERYIDQTDGIHEVTRGETSQRRQTAREAILLKQSGESRMKLKIKLGEEMGLKDFGEKAIQTIDQFAQPDDIIDKVGLERAASLPSINPANIEGGFTFSFKGSSRTADNLIQRQDAKDLFQLMAGNPVISQNWLGNWTLEKFEVTDEERRKAVRSDEEIQQRLDAEQAAANSQRSASSGRNLGAQIGVKPSGKDVTENLGAV